MWWWKEEEEEEEEEVKEAESPFANDDVEKKEERVETCGDRH